MPHACTAAMAVFMVYHDLLNPKSDMAGHLLTEPTFFC